VADKTEKEIDALYIGILYVKAYRINKGDSRRQVKFDYTLGNLGFKDPADKAIDEAGPNTNGYYSKINLSLTENIVFNSKWSLDSLLAGQYALQGKNLDGSEDFTIGGPSRVKFYPSGEHSAENGYLLNMELYYNLPDYKEISSRVSIFYDYGYATMADQTPGFDSRSLQDIGLGY
jgi:hemolysin activation/secretion protein